MTDIQWEILKKIARGEIVVPAPVGFIIDSPWLPNWYGISLLDYFSNDALWLKANLKAVRDFPDVMFLPGFWSEFGMCTEPSAFGSRCTFPQNEFPFAHKTIHSSDDIDALTVPDPSADGLLPLVLNRLKLAQPQIEASGHKIRFAVSRGPLNIASYMMGSTEFMTTMMMEPDKAHALLKTITSFIKKWLLLQRETFPSIDGIFLLDDIIGFLGEEEFRTFCLPYFQELFDPAVSIRFLHNDAACRVCAPFLPETNVNLFNMGFDVPLGELKQMTQNKVVLLGNIPPRDVLASHDKEKIAGVTRQLVDSLADKTRIVFSCGGGMPPGATSEDVLTFVKTVRD